MQKHSTKYPIDSDVKFPTRSRNLPLSLHPRLSRSLEDSTRSPNYRQTSSEWTREHPICSTESQGQVSTKRPGEIQQVSPRGGKTSRSLVSGLVLRAIKMDVEKRRRDARAIRTGKHQVRSLCEIISTERAFVSVAQTGK